MKIGVSDIRVTFTNLGSTVSTVFYRKPADPSWKDDIT